MGDTDTLKITVAEVGRIPLGNTKRFYQLVTLPHVGFLVILCAAGIITGEELPILGSRFAAMVYVVGFKVLLDFRFRSFTVKTLMYHLSGLVTLLTALSVQFDASPISIVYVPSIISLAAILLVPVIWEAVLFICAPSITILTVWAYVGGFITSPDGVIGLSTVFAVILLLVAKGFLGDGPGPVFVDESAQAAQSSSDEPEQAERVEETQRERYHRRMLIRAAQNVFSEDAVSECAWHYIVGCLMVGAMVFGSAILFEYKSKQFALVWVLLALFEVFLIARMLRQRRLRSVFQGALLVSLSGFGWWVMTFVLNIGSPIFSTGLLAAVIYVFGTLPLPQSYSVTVSSVGLALLGVELAYTPHPFVVAVFVPILILVVLRTSARNYLSFLIRTITSVLAKSSESGPMAVSSLRVLAWQLALACDVKTALLVFGSSRAERVIGGTPCVSHVDARYLRGLVQKIDDLGKDEGLVEFDELGSQFMTPLLDWFGMIPSGVFFLRFRAVINDREERVTVFLPVSVTTRLAGVKNTFRALIGVASIVRVSLDASRVQFLSSGALITTQRSVSERELELSRVVHYVNNVAQDIAIKCENLKERVKSVLLGVPMRPEQGRVYDLINELELQSRLLSARVTDVKLTKELLLAKDIGRVEKVAVDSVLPDLESFGKASTFDKSTEFSLSSYVAPGRGVRVASREFLETALRSFVYVATARLDSQGEIAFKVSDSGDFVLFEIQDTGVPFSREERAAALSQPDAQMDGKQERLISALRAVDNLAAVSGGQFEFMPPEGRFTNRIGLFLPACLISDEVKTVPGQWALLVDDNPEVTTFYSRVAAALHLNYSTAESVREAEDILSSQGRPRLVITDIQLKEGTGIELLKSLRVRFGPLLPVIVVSGEVDERIATELRSAGATKFLAKPVS